MNNWFDHPRYRTTTWSIATATALTIILFTALLLGGMATALIVGWFGPDLGTIEGTIAFIMVSTATTLTAGLVIDQTTNDHRTGGVEDEGI